MILATGGEASSAGGVFLREPGHRRGTRKRTGLYRADGGYSAGGQAIFDSKTFDNGTICASEQSIVTERCIEAAVAEELERQGGYFMTPEQSEQVGGFMLQANGTMNPRIVGNRPRPSQIWRYPYSFGNQGIVQADGGGEETHTPGKSSVPFWRFTWSRAGSRRATGASPSPSERGAGHTMTIHSKNQEVIREFALKKPVSRLLVNTRARWAEWAPLQILAPP